jgi:casein kinase 1
LRFSACFEHEGCLSRHQGVDHIFIKALLQFGAGFQFDYVFDWTILKYQQSQSTGGPQRTSPALGGTSSGATGAGAVVDHVSGLHLILFIQI